MKVKKIKFEQYRVRGKHRDFDVLVVPPNKHMWAYYERFDERYEIDGDLVAYQSLKYALPVYFPTSEILGWILTGKTIWEMYHNNER